MLFDPFKKQFDLPTTFVELRDHERRQHKVVRQKHKPFAGFDVEVMNSSQRFGIRLRRFDARQHNRLVAAKTGRLVDDPRLPTLGIEVLFGACQKECGLLVQPVQTRIVDVRLVHDVERAPVRSTVRPGCLRRAFFRAKRKENRGYCRVDRATCEA